MKASPDASAPEVQDHIPVVEPHQRPSLAFIAFLIVALGGVAVVSPYALLFAVFDLPWAMAALLPGVALGMIALPVLRLGNVSRSWHFILSAALGIGLWSQLILVLGLLGWLERWLFLGIVGASAAYMLLWWRRLMEKRHGGEKEPRSQEATEPRGERTSRTLAHWLWMLVAPFLTLAILAAMNAPGFLWKEEGFGYDVLEYHLQLPREYFDEGMISHRPHNVYANFPANVEMLYLAAMVLTGQPQESGTICHLIHLLLGVMTVAAIWRTAADWSPRAGVVAGVVAGTVGWLPYLSGLAYVELGMLFFGATAMGCVVRSQEAMRRRSHEGGGWGWVALGGVLGGFACGCKYTALPMVAVPIGIAMLTLLEGWVARVKAVALFALLCLLSFSPWLIKNAVMTGNPVFPLAQRVFDATPPGWGAAETAKWNSGHRPRADKSELGDRFAALWRNLPGDHQQRFGPVIFLLGMCGVVGVVFAGMRRRMNSDVAHGGATLEKLPALGHVTPDEGKRFPHARYEKGFSHQRATLRALVIVLVVQLLVWTFATHLFARFAVVMLIPLALLGGGVGSGLRSRAGQVAMSVFVIAGAVWNFYFGARLHADEAPVAAPAALFYEGRVPGFEFLGYLNGELPKDAKIQMVGDARPFYVQRDVEYCVVFNRNPFVEAIEGAKAPADIVAWLRERGYTHVLVHWMEIARLRRTYGFSERIDEAVFNGLEGAGLSKLRDFSAPGADARYVALYEVVRE